jgi:hypothetical protein
MAFADIVASLKIAEVKKVRAVDNIAWILNCIPLPQEHEHQLKKELNEMTLSDGVTYQVVDGFIMLQS